MLEEDVMQHAELYFRMHVHTTLPLHAVLVETMCKARCVPLELATVLEDIGQGYCRMADQVNAELVRRNQLASEPDAADSAEARITDAVERVVAGLGHVVFVDGQVVDARLAVEAHPVAVDALRAALTLARITGATPSLDTRVVRSERGSPKGALIDEPTG